MAFLRLCTLFLVLVLEFSSCKDRIADPDTIACLIEMYYEEGFYHEEGRLGTNIPSGEPDGANYNFTVKSNNKEIKCGKYMKASDLSKEPNKITLPKKLLNFLKEKYKFKEYSDYAIVFYNGGSELEFYLNKTYNTPLYCNKAYWLVYNINASMFYDGYNSKKGGDVVFEYVPPVYCPASTYVFQLHIQDGKIENPNTETDRNDFNEYEFHKEKIHKVNGIKSLTYLGSPVNALYFRMYIISKEIDKCFRKLQDSIIEALEKLEPSTLEEDVKKLDSSIQSAMELYEKTKNGIQLNGKNAAKELETLLTQCSIVLAKIKAEKATKSLIPKVSI